MKERVLGIVLVCALAACGKPSAPAPDAAAGAAPATVPATAAAPPATSPADAAPDPAPAALAPAVQTGEVLSDQWYETRSDGKKDGWYHMIWTRSSVDGKPTIHDHTEHVEASTRVMGETEDVFTSHLVTDLERTEAGMLLTMRAEQTTEDRTEESTIRFTGDAYERTAKVAGLAETRRVPTPQALPVDAEAFLAPIIRAGEMAPGKKLSFQVANYEGYRLETVQLWVDAKEEIATPVGRVPCWRVREFVVGRPGNNTTWWLDEKGVLCRRKSGTGLVERTTPEKARRLDASGAAYKITIAAHPTLPRCTSASRSVVDVTIRRSEDLELPDFPKTPFSREIARADNVITLELTSHEDPAATCAFPVADPAVAKWLESSNLYSPQDKSVQRAMRGAIGDAKDGRTAVKRILRFVFTTLKKQSGPIPQPTAPEILACEMGDCSEHAVLFVALCRAAGIPARRLSGYAQVGDMWGAHSFCEVWLGKWVGADPTTNELGTMARYVCFGWDEDPDSYPGLVSSRIQDRIKIRTVEFTDAGERVVIADAKEEKGDLDGLRTAPAPEDWSVTRGDGDEGLAVEGPDVKATVRVIFGMGDTDPGLLIATHFGAGKLGTFAGRPSITQRSGTRRKVETIVVPWRRRLVILYVRSGPGAPEDAAQTLEKVLAPTFADGPN